VPGWRLVERFLAQLRREKQERGGARTAGRRNNWSPSPAAVVDVVERRIPNRITYPLIAVGVLGLPWLTQPVTRWALLAPLLGATASGAVGLLNAVMADQGLGDVKQ